ncbi:MAG: cytochrome c oxidase subunit II [Pseudomonadales bacterium]|nr:cytochrome c oxidase subunit II [Pseudomonadales bacterium]
MFKKVAVFGLFLALVPTVAFSDWQLNLNRGVTDTSIAVYDLHMLVLYICVAISVVVFGVMFWSIYHHRKSKGFESHEFHDSTALEILWTIVPTIILIVILFPATKALINSYDTEESDIDIQITGYQWKWRYKYIGEDLDFFSVLTTPTDEIRNKSEKNENYLLEVDKPLVVPINKKIRFLLTSNDVIHAWWVPDLAVKKDAIPGFINEDWTRINEVGIYRGQCAELCGKDHGFMPIVVKAVTQEDYVIWLAEQKALKEIEAAASQADWSMEALLVKGEGVYIKNCAACHQPNGMGIPPVFPAIKGSPIALGPIGTHLATVFEGRPGTAMAGFGEQLSSVDIAAVITYQRNAWGNEVGDMLSPTDVDKLKGGE